MPTQVHACCIRTDCNISTVRRKKKHPCHINTNHVLILDGLLINEQRKLATYIGC